MMGVGLIGREVEGTILQIKKFWVVVTEEREFLVCVKLFSWKLHA